jgi:phenylacetate-CoA ligase
MVLPTYVVDDPSLPRLPSGELRRMQGERLAAMASYVYERSPFWRRKFDAAGVGPAGIRHAEDVRRLPTCTKAELQADQEENPPFGSYTCSPASDWVKFFTTSGTTGRPLRRLMSGRDWRQVIDRLGSIGLYQRGDLVFVATPVDALMGATATTDVAAAAGAVVIQGGVWPDRQKVRTIAELRPAVVTGPPSYLVHLTELAAAAGIDLRDRGKRLIISFGEPGAGVASTNRLLRERFGAQAVVDGYGITELFPLGASCPVSTDMHLREDLLLVECLRPGGEEPVPAGEIGELTFTNLVGDTQPLLRFRTGDLGVLSDGAPCGCGSTHVRIVGSVQGRADDMIWFHGANIFPSAVEAIVRDIAGLGAEYRLVVAEEAGLASLTLQVEMEPSIQGVDRAALVERTAAALKTTVKRDVLIEVLEPGTLARSDGMRKLSRVLDTRAAPVG